MPPILVILVLALSGFVLPVPTNAPGVKSLRSAHLENLFSIDGKVLSGSSPHDEQGFQELKALGVKTIISVDGGKPDVETARKYGMRYIHIPIGSTARLYQMPIASPKPPIRPTVRCTCIAIMESTAALRRWR